MPRVKRRAFQIVRLFFLPAVQLPEQPSIEVIHQQDGDAPQHRRLHALVIHLHEGIWPIYHALDVQPQNDAAVQHRGQQRPLDRTAGRRGVRSRSTKEKMAASGLSR